MDVSTGTRINLTPSARTLVITFRKSCADQFNQIALTLKHITMNNYERIKEKIANGYFILCEEFTTGVKIHSIVKQEDETTKTIFCEVATNVAKMLAKELNISISIKSNCVALNYKPEAVEFNHIRTTHY